VYALSEIANVKFTIFGKKKGRRVGKRCVKPTRRNRGKKACTRFVKRGSFTQSSVASSNRKKWSGKLHGKPLEPGRYRATLRATDGAGNVSKKRNLDFQIVRP
jgi:hypothetical protein